MASAFHCVIAQGLMISTGTKAQTPHKRTSLFVHHKSPVSKIDRFHTGLRYLEAALILKRNTDKVRREPGIQEMCIRDSSTSTRNWSPRPSRLLA